jgi:TonB family protein
VTSRPRRGTPLYQYGHDAGTAESGLVWVSVKGLFFTGPACEDPVQKEKWSTKLAARASAPFVLCLLLAVATSANDRVTVDSTLPAALCQVVYPLDESADVGYRYMFFGNGFFINDDGYLITAAHLLSYFRNGGVPYVLVGPHEGPRRMFEAPIAAVDWDHDVAVLHATPNPFQSETKIAYLALSAETPVSGDVVISASLRPPDVENAHSLTAPLEDFSQGQVIAYRFYRERGTGERELLLFSKEVSPGQSGAPLVSANTHAAVGVIVGQWLHPTVIPSGANGGHLTLAPGAALRIHYAIALLRQNRIRAEMASESPKQAEPTERDAGFSAPVPLSVVVTPYPPQALFGGDVLLDALVDSSGELTDVRVVAGDSPFLESVLSAVRTWSFEPARRDGRAVATRIGIVFQFPQSFLPNVVSKEHRHQGPSSDSGDRAALPVVTVEPDYPTSSVAEGSVVLYASINSKGQLTSTAVLHDVASLTAPTVAALQHWQFVPGQEAGAQTVSGVVVVETFRRPAL